MGLLEEPHQRPPFFPPLVGPLFGSDVYPTAPSYSGLGMVASQLDEQHHHLALVGGAGISDTVGGEAVEVCSLSTVANSRVVAGIPKMETSGTLLVRSCNGYMSTPQALGKQAHKAALKASTNAWQSHLPLLMLHAPTLVCSPCGIVVESRPG